MVTTGAAQAVNSDAVTAITTLAVGHRLADRYDVLERIGSGGMADVFRGWDDLFHRPVAIKVLKLERIDELMKRRVLREARASCAVDHPHMLRVTDMGFVGEAPYLVSDLLHGETLAEALRRARAGSSGAGSCAGCCRRWTRCTWATRSGRSTATSSPRTCSSTAAAAATY